MALSPWLGVAWVAFGVADLVPPPNDDPLPAVEETQPDTPPPVSEVAEGEVAAAPAGFSTALNGYFDTRFNYNGVDTSGLLDASNLPSWSNLTEANVQLKLRWGDSAFVLGDASFFYQRGWGFQMGTSDGSLPVPDHDVPQYRPLALVNEIYGSYNVTEHANITLGKKRIVWGPGLAINPTDLLNPPKDPTDPTFQRAGAWLLRAEFPFELFTVSLVGAAKVLSQYGGVPSSLLLAPPFPSYENTLAPGAFPDARDHDAHFAVAARFYALLANTDLNAHYLLTNLYNDAFRHKSRFGLSASRFVWGALELHGEVLLQQGSARNYVNEGCLDSLNSAMTCAADNSLVGTSQRDSGIWAARTLVGSSYTFDDETLVSLEYFFAGDGYTDKEFELYGRVLQFAQMAQRQGRTATLPMGTTTDPGSPQKFTFDNVRRHYLFITYMRPHLFDDWTVNAVLLLGAEDLSGVFVPSVTWSAQEWLNLSAFAFLVIPGPVGLQTSAGGQKLSEFGLLPMDWRVMLSARVFY